MSGLTHYEILGITPDASAEVVHSAWRAKAREYHPDRNQSADAGEKLVRVNQAYQVLSSPDKRRDYDLSLFAPKSTSEHQEFAERVRNAQSSPAFNAAFGGAEDDFDFSGPSLGDITAHIADQFAAQYIGRNPLLRAAFRRVRPDIHKTIKRVLKEETGKGRRARA